MTPDLLTRPQICRRLGISRWTWTRWVAQGIAPEPTVAGGRGTGRLARWRAIDIEPFIASGLFRIAGKRTYFSKGRAAKQDAMQHARVLGQERSA